MAEDEKKTVELDDEDLEEVAGGEARVPDAIKGALKDYEESRKNFIE